MVLFVVNEVQQQNILSLYLVGYLIVICHKQVGMDHFMLKIQRILMIYSY